MNFTPRAVRRLVLCTLAALLLVTCPGAAQEAGGTAITGQPRTKDAGEDASSFGLPGEFSWFFGRWRLVDAYLPANLPKADKNYWMSVAKDTLTASATFTLTTSGFSYDGSGLFSKGGGERPSLRFKVIRLSQAFHTAEAHDLSGRRLDLSKPTNAVAWEPETCWSGDPADGVKLHKCPSFLLAHREDSNRMFLYWYNGDLTNVSVQVVFEFERATS